MFLIWSLAPSKKPDSRHCPQTVSHVLVTNVLIPYWDATPSANPLHPWTCGRIVENPWPSADPTLTFAPSVGCDMHQPPVLPWTPSMNTSPQTPSLILHLNVETANWSPDTSLLQSSTVRSTSPIAIIPISESRDIITTYQYVRHCPRTVSGFLDGA